MHPLHQLIIFYYIGKVLGCERERDSDGDRAHYIDGRKGEFYKAAQTICM